jgi:hypothetical protein
MSIRSRLERLEGSPVCRASIWDVLCGARGPEALDAAVQAALRDMLAAAGVARETVEEKLAALLQGAGTPFAPDGPRAGSSVPAVATD